ncbi:MAG: hypothetical protein ACKJRP_03985 [SAR86 cluster bacterium]|jgi:hypothetical protein
MRCKACDIKLNRVFWNKPGNRLEDLCRDCRELILLPPTGEELVLEDGYLGVDYDKLD